MPAGIRFRPPPLDPPAELRWLLAAAYGPGWEPPPSRCATRRIAELAGSFDLGPRIVARHGARRLRRCLGRSADSLEHAHRRAVALSLACDHLAAEVALHAERLATPIIFLKGFALHRLAPGPAGWRPLTDLDLLLASARATELRAALEAAGFRSLPVPANEQHLAPLVSPAGTPIDLHFRLRGVTLGSGWASAEEVLAAAVCEPLAGFAGSVWVPSRALLIAHLLVHGVDQHGFRPGNYPLLRLLADIVDLLPPAADPPPGMERWIAAAVSPNEAEAVIRLCRLLAAGELPGSEDGPARILLRHIVASTLDPRYARGLRRRHTSGRLRTAWREGHFGRYLARKLLSERGRAGNGTS